MAVMRYLLTGSEREQDMTGSGDIPRMGLGTFGRTGSAGRAAIEMAVEIGYRHFDTAQDYGTEANVGTVMRGSGLPRSDLFVTTKIATDNLGAGRVIPSLEKSLEITGLDYFDLVLIHWPSPDPAITPSFYLPQLRKAQEQGLAHLIGVSNFTVRLLKESISILGTGVIAANQVELHPYLQNKTLAAFCDANDIVVTCYLPIAKGRLGGDPVLGSIAAAHDAGVEQVALAYEMAKGYAVIPASGQRAHLESNFAAQRLELRPDEISRIETVDRGERYIDPSWGPDWDR